MEKGSKGSIHSIDEIISDGLRLWDEDEVFVIILLMS
jgi:hypothetical protein